MEGRGITKQEVSIESNAWSYCRKLLYREYLRVHARS